MGAQARIHPAAPYGYSLDAQGAYLGMDRRAQRQSRSTASCGMCEAPTRWGKHATDCRHGRHVGGNGWALLAILRTARECLGSGAAFRPEQKRTKFRETGKY